jgi:tetratricopeptide (TPR) repeat protein
MNSRHHIASWIFGFALLGVSPRGVVAQDRSLELGIAAMQLYDYSTARWHLEQAVRTEPQSYEANWRLGLVLIDLGQQTPDDVKSPARDSLYALAESYARRAVAAKPSAADGHFVLGTAIARASLTVSRKERIKRATEIFTEATTAIKLDPRHDGAYHLLGRWHSEIMLLSPLQKFFAKTFMGGAIFNQASWDGAEKNLRTAVEYAPLRIFHRLDLAIVLADREKWSDAKVQVDAIAALPPVEPMDVTYRRQAETLRQRIVGKLSP